jgi:hypothetical protein
LPHAASNLTAWRRVHGNSFGEFYGELVNVDDIQRILVETITYGKLRNLRQNGKR